MSCPDDLNTSTFFENRRTHFNSIHEMEENRVRGRRSPQRSEQQQYLDATNTRFPPSPRQYEPQEFDLCEGEPFQHPRMFENMTYETNAAALEAMRAQNARPPYRQQPQFNISDLPSERLEEFSNPQFSESYEGECPPSQPKTPDICDVSAPDFCDISDASPWPEQTPQRRIRSLMRQRRSQPTFSQKRTSDICDISEPNYSAWLSQIPSNRAQSSQHQQRRRSYTDECFDDESARIYESSQGSPTPQIHYTPIDLMATPDVCAPTPPAPTPTPPPHLSPIRLQPSPVQYPSECLEDISVPSFQRTPPTPPRFPMPQDLPSDMVCDESAPTFGSPPSPSMSFPSEDLVEMTMPSFENASCGSPLDRRFLLDSRLAEESPPDFASSRFSSPTRSTSFRDPTSSRACPTTSPLSQAQQQNYQSTPVRRRSSPPRRFDLARLMSQRIAAAECSPLAAPSPTEECTPRSAAPHFSYYSPTPVRRHSIPKDLTSECLGDISEPSYYNSISRDSPYMRSLPSNLPSECLGDISEPVFERTPPARTPSLPQDLPSELICDMSQPLYDTPRSEHLSSMTMPSFEDASCGSPLDRRFLLDSKIMDESPPSFVLSSRSLSPCRSASPCAQRAGPCPSASFARSRATTPQRQVPSPQFSPTPRGRSSRSPSPQCSPIPPASHFSLRSPTPVRSPAKCPMPMDLPKECLTDITEPEYYSSYRSTPPPQRPFPSDMGSECLSDIRAPYFEMTPAARTPSMPHDLPSDMICDVSSPKYQSPGSEHLSVESMPSFADTSCGSPLDRRFVLDPYLADETMPSMVSSRTPSPSPERFSPSCAKDEPSFDKTYSEILQRFNSLKCKLESPNAVASTTTGDGSPAGECVRETVIERTENENGQLESTTQHIVVTIDQCGSIKTQTNEIKTQYPGTISKSPSRLAPPSADSGILTQSPRPGAQIEGLRNSVRRRLSFDLSDMPSDNLADVSPPCADDLPSMSTENILQQLSSIPEEQLSNISAPSYRTPPIPSVSYPSERLDQMSMPSFENASCGSPLDRRFLLDPRLADESPPQFASSYVSAPGVPYESRSPTSQSSYMRTRTQTPSPTAPAQRQFKAAIHSPQRFQPPLSSSTDGGRSSTPLRRFSLRPLTPTQYPPARPFPTNLPHEQLTDISQPSFFSSAPTTPQQKRYLPMDIPSERIDDVSQPTFQKTPPPKTPDTPTNLPSEMLGNISAPSYRSPASEHISSVTMPSFQDVSYESPLDRRFLLDPRLADETMPSLPRTPQSPDIDTPRAGTSAPRPGAARRRLSYSQPDTTRGGTFRGANARSSSDGRNGQGGRGPATVEQTHTTVQQSGTYEQQHSVTPAGNEPTQFRSQGRHGQSPLIDASKEQLHITTSIHSITRVYPEKAGETTTGRRKRSLSLPSENLGDISMPSGPPSMGISTSTTKRSQRGKMSTISQDLNDISMPPSPPSMSTTRTGRSPPRTGRRRSVQDVNDITPISFASTLPSTDRSGSTTRGGRNATGKYLSTSSRGFSGLANYAPFCDQIRSRNNSNTCDPCDPCCPIVQNVDSCDSCDPCAGFLNSNRSRKTDTC
uniref:Uncharacterized protein n=1 Tax=Ceratitis capitata TaxID=7213 RepID=W8B311_CERCA